MKSSIISSVLLLTISATALSTTKTSTDASRDTEGLAGYGEKCGWVFGEFFECYSGLYCSGGICRARDDPRDPRDPNPTWPGREGDSCGGRSGRSCDANGNLYCDYTWSRDGYGVCRREPRGNGQYAGKGEYCEGGYPSCYPGLTCYKLAHQSRGYCIRYGNESASAKKTTA
jgi:hypothetical protein